MILKHKKFNARKIARIMELAGSGLTFRQISKRLKIPYSSVYAYLARGGIWLESSSKETFSYKFMRNGKWFSGHGFKTAEEAGQAEMKLKSVLPKTSKTYKRPINRKKPHPNKRLLKKKLKALPDPEPEFIRYGNTAYGISMEGRVKRIVPYITPTGGIILGNELVPFLKRGVEHVRLAINGKEKPVSITKMFLETFVGDVSDTLENLKDLLKKGGHNEPSNQDAEGQ